MQELDGTDNIYICSILQFIGSLMIPSNKYYYVVIQVFSSTVFVTPNSFILSNIKMQI